MFSKCRFQRSEFMEDMELARIENIVYPRKVELDKGPEEPTEFQKANFKPCYWDMTFRVWLGSYPEEKALLSFLKMIRDVPEEKLAQAVCTHDWVCITDCMFGCCKAVPQEDSK
jgi:hypothetical protein